MFGTINILSDRVVNSTRNLLNSGSICSNHYLEPVCGCGKNAVCYCCGEGYGQVPCDCSRGYWGAIDVNVPRISKGRCS